MITSTVLAGDLLPGEEVAMRHEDEPVSVARIAAVATSADHRHVRITWEFPESGTTLAGIYPADTAFEVKE